MTCRRKGFVSGPLEKQTSASFFTVRRKRRPHRAAAGHRESYSRFLEQLHNRGAAVPVTTAVCWLLF